MKSMCHINCIFLGHICQRKRKSQNDNDYTTNFVVIMYIFPQTLEGEEDALVDLIFGAVAECQV